MMTICTLFIIITSFQILINTQYVADKLAVADAAIVGSTFKDTRKDAGEVSAAHVQEFIAAVD